MVVRIEWCWRAMCYGGGSVVVRRFVPRVEGGEIMPTGKLARLGHGGDVHGHRHLPEGVIGAPLGPFTCSG
jgi:hypothetical protein